LLVLLLRAESARFAEEPEVMPPSPASGASVFVADGIGTADEAAAGCQRFVCERFMT